MQVLKAAPPCWGYRRLWAYLRLVEPRPVNKQRLWRLMREHRLLVPPTLRLKAKRTPPGRRPKPTQPNQGWGLARTKVLVAGVGWVDIVMVLDWPTQVGVGHDAGRRCPSQHWLAALAMAVKRPCPAGVRGPGVSLLRDHGCQPPSMACMHACATVEIPQACTRDHHPKGKADTARGIRPLTEECLWRQAWTCPLALIRARKDGLTHDNEPYLPSPLGYQPPRQCERDDLNRHRPPFVAA